MTIAAVTAVQDTRPRAGLRETMGDLPVEVRRTLTWDQDREMACHDQLAELLIDDVFFAYPGRPWERALNEPPRAS